MTFPIFRYFPVDNLLQYMSRLYSPKIERNGQGDNIHHFILKKRRRRILSGIDEESHVRLSFTINGCNKHK
jgi:hypothetical protein